MHKIIDAHSHLGDIFAYQKNVIYSGDVEIDPDKYNPFEAFSEKGFTGPFLDPNNPEEIQNVIDMTAEASNANTLTKLSHDLDEAGVDYVCLYPVSPFINFDDYRAAACLEPRILPFTSVDWSKNDPEGAKKALLEDHKNGAYGLKIHPILQKINLRDPQVEDVLNTWALTDLPVVSHCGVNSYYPDDMKHAEAPENGSLDDFMYLAKKMPHVKFIAAHAGGLNGGEMEILAENLAGTPNLWVDTTFRSAEEMKTMVELFGADRVLFGVDRPFGESNCSVDVAFEAFGKDTDLSEKIMYSNVAKLIKLI